MSHDTEKAEMAIADLLFKKGWYCDDVGCRIKAKEILALPQIAVRRTKSKKEVSRVSSL